MIENDSAIGVFDSGVGGVSILKEIFKILPNENVIYCADSKNVPWSEKTEIFLMERIFQIIQFLMSKKVKMMIIGSNTATSMALDKAQKEYTIQIQGVIKPAIQKVIEMTKNKRIGIIGTPVTIKKNLHEQLIREIEPSMKVFKNACKKDLIEYVENGFQGDKNIISQEIRRCAKELVIHHHIDTLILGCTQYSFLRKQVEEEIGTEIKILDPAESTVLHCRDILQEKKLLNQKVIKGEFKKYVFYNSAQLEYFKEIIMTLTGLKEKEFELLQMNIG